MQDKKERGSLRKGAFYLARIVYLNHRTEIDDLITNSSAHDRKAEVARKLIEALDVIGTSSFDDARITFTEALQKYLKNEGGNEDAALKNTKFAQQVDEQATPKEPPTSGDVSAPSA